MDYLLTQIKKGLEVELYTLSLFVALCIPDICGAIESENGETSAKKYKEWLEKNLTMNKDKFTPDDIYNFRCALLHQGKTKHNKSSFKGILFFDPESLKQKNITLNLHCCRVGSGTESESFLIDINKFCNDLVNATQAWIKRNKNNPNFNKNYKKIIRRYPKGISPVCGSPVIL